MVAPQGGLSRVRSLPPALPAAELLLEEPGQEPVPFRGAGAPSRGAGRRGCARGPVQGTVARRAGLWERRVSRVPGSRRSGSPAGLDPSREDHAVKRIRARSAADARAGGLLPPV